MQVLLLLLPSLLHLEQLLHGLVVLLLQTTLILILILAVLSLILGLIQNLLQKLKVYVLQEGRLHAFVIQKLKFCSFVLLHSLLNGTALFRPAVNNRVLARLEALIFYLLAVLLCLLNTVVAEGGLTRFATIAVIFQLLVVAIFARRVFGFKKDFFGINT